mmetsp:Transcript_32348/g.67669  ORF Transcript_32348/g.67669 Transcript_32348/m.67669 type:complete len:213 (+) Transcript_32348:64-702(+)
MPATAGRIGMPADNRLSVSDSLKTTEVWQKTVGYDPYAGEDEVQNQVSEGGEINKAAKGLFRLAQLTGHSSTIAPGACKRCGSVGHLYFQCRNMFSLKKEDKKNEQFVAEADEDDDDVESNELPSSESDDDDSSDSDDSDDDDSAESESSSSSSHKKRKRKKSSKKDKKDKKDKKKKKEKKKKSKKRKKSSSSSSDSSDSSSDSSDSSSSSS